MEGGTPTRPGPRSGEAVGWMRGARIAGALCTLALGVVLGQASCAATEDVSPGTGASTSTTSTGGRGGGGGGTTTTTTTTTTSSGGGKDGGTGGAGGGTGGAGGGVGGAGGGGVGGAGGAGGSGGSGGSGGTGGNCAAIEVCNGLDDTCNGQIDEGDPGGNVPCMAAALGECKFGTTHCQNGAVKCVAALPVPEVCDGLDNNCDGNVDEGNPGGGIQCMTGLLGLCANGITSCQGVNGVMCVPSVTPGQLPESCNGLDDDCDGLTDDGIVQVGQPCTANGFVGICQFGTYICPSVQPIQLTCDHPAPGTVQETCNGQDDDCNGTIDDPALLNNLPCASGFPGVCAAGHTLCVGGSSSCVPNIQPGMQTEICNNVDDNCNGQTDEMNPNPACTTQNPGAQFVQSWNCNAGTCEIAQCQSGHADIDTAPGNGCECTTDAYANSCAVAGTVSVPSNGTVNMVGKIETANGSDFLTFNFTVPAVGSPYHPKIELTDSAGGQYAMDVLVNCNNAAGCSTTGGANNENGIQVNVWEQNYNAYTAGAGCCSDNTPRVGSVKVRVYRKFANQPTCASYTVTGTNL